MPRRFKWYRRRSIRAWDGESPFGPGVEDSLPQDRPETVTLAQPIIEDFIPPRSWYRLPEPVETPEILERRREAQVELLETLLGAGAWASLSPGQRRIVDELMLEMIPPRHGWQPGYSGPVRVAIVTGMGEDGGDLRFWINAGRVPRRSGRRLIGPTKGSLSVRTGYALACQPPEEHIAVSLRFVTEVCDLADRLGLVFIGSGDEERQDIDQKEMRGLAADPYWFRRLLSLRVWAVTSQRYLFQWRRHFAETPYWFVTEDGELGCYASDGSRVNSALKRAAGLGVTLADLAIVLGVTTSYACACKHGRRRWPCGALNCIETFLDATEAAVVAAVDGPWMRLEPLPPRPKRGTGRQSRIERLYACFDRPLFDSSGVACPPM